MLITAVFPKPAGAATTVRAQWPLLVSTFLPMVAFGIVFPSIAEEPGWRGFALPRLPARHSPVAASLILGTLHGLWHLPALLTVNFGPLPLANIVPFILTAAFATVIYTWVYNRTGGSVLLAILLLAASNAASTWLGKLLVESGIGAPSQGVAGYLASSYWINAIAYGLVALLLIVSFMAVLGHLRGRERPEKGYARGLAPRTPYSSDSF